MRNVFFIILTIFSFVSCDKSPTLGEFVYMEGDLVHLTKDCKDAEFTVLVKSTNLFQNTHKHKGKYYRDAATKNFWEVQFCSSCISESEMNAIEDSIAKYDNRYE